MVLIKDAKGNPDKAPVLYSQNAVTVSISPDSEQMIAIDDSKDGSMKAFNHLLGAKGGYVELADVTIVSETKRVLKKKVDATPAMKAFTSRDTAGDETGTIWSLGDEGQDADSEDILDLDGTPIDAGLRGTLTISVAGTRGLFNDGDMMFVDYDGDGNSGDSEEIELDGKVGEGSARSINPDKSDSFSGGDVSSTGNFAVHYMASGQGAINHESMITVTASVDYNDPSAKSEGAKSSTATLKFAGVGNPVMAYAIPHSANGNGDKGNVRVRCEEAPPGDEEACRVFLECWDQMGNRGFGEAPMVGET